MAERETLIREKVTELVAAGGTAGREDHDGDVLDHVAMADPEGNEFRVA